MSRWFWMLVLAFGAVGCGDDEVGGEKGPGAKGRPGANKVEQDAPAAPAPADAEDVMPVVPPVTDGTGFTVVYDHSLDGEIEPCG